eukprot:1353373-Amorphochlora_amoeboformis.AAC.2
MDVLGEQGKGNTYMQHARQRRYDLLPPLRPPARRPLPPLLLRPRPRNPLPRLRGMGDTGRGVGLGQVSEIWNDNNGELDVTLDIPGTLLRDILCTSFCLSLVPQC